MQGFQQLTIKKRDFVLITHRADFTPFEFEEVLEHLLDAAGNILVESTDVILERN